MMGQIAHSEPQQVLNAAEVAGTLNGLIKILHDGREGFTEAARRAQSPALKGVLREYAAQRERFARALEGLVSAQNIEPAHGVTFNGTLHRAWMDVRTAFTGQMSDSAILDECERGEDAAVAAYEKAIKQSLPESILSTVEQQYTAVTQAHDHVRNLRNSGQYR